MSKEKSETKSLWQKINFLNLGIMHLIALGSVYFVLIIIDVCFKTNLTLSLLLTMTSYLGYPLYVVFKAQTNNQLYSIKKIKKISIINGAIVSFIWILLGGSGGAVFLWGWIGYDLMKDRIALNEDINENPNITIPKVDDSETKNNVRDVDNRPDMHKKLEPAKSTVKITVKRKTNSGSIARNGVC